MIAAPDIPGHTVTGVLGSGGFATVYRTWQDAVGRETGVAEGRETAVAEGDGVGFAETDATGDGLVTGTGFSVPTTVGEAVALGEATSVWPKCFSRAFFSKLTAANPSAPAISSANRMPGRIIFSENFGGLR